MHNFVGETTSVSFGTLTEKEMTGKATETEMSTSPKNIDDLLPGFFVIKLNKAFSGIFF